MKNLAKAAMTAGAVVVLSLGALSVPGVARAGVAISIDVAPPPPRVEVLPPPRVGYVWAPGHWEWVGAAAMPGLVACGCRPGLATCITGRSGANGMDIGCTTRGGALGAALRVRLA
ncbi:YXWGXW repeat-containing protein [Achromobacter xylosoxidans]|uniref:YXWGXW repeat-containing protein n=1 Tax=Alcaligenes xylosoxydans xylosoxydans TaxID=85698 RepID=UPI001ED8E746|nr:YXWGXW repeat-containing protein [Achromobacter xylosoxidans]